MSVSNVRCWGQFQAFRQCGIPSHTGMEDRRIQKGGKLLNPPKGEGHPRPPNETGGGGGGGDDQRSSKSSERFLRPVSRALRGRKIKSLFLSATNVRVRGLVSARCSVPP